MKLLVKIANILKPKDTIILGRWSLKHDVKTCETYIKNYYGDPGYPNQYKKTWIKNQSSKN